MVRNLIAVPLALVTLLAAGCVDDIEPGVKIPWAKTLSEGNWEAGHGRVYWASPPAGLGSELFLFDQRSREGVCPADFEEDPFADEVMFFRIWLPSLDEGMYAITAHPPEEDYTQATVRVIRGEDGHEAAVLRAISGTLTVTQVGAEGGLEVGIDATLATGAEEECLYGIGTPDWCSCIAESGRRFECEGLGCCFGEGTIPFSIDVTSRYCPELCSATEEPLYEFCEES